MQPGKLVWRKCANTKTSRIFCVHVWSIYLDGISYRISDAKMLFFSFNSRNATVIGTSRHVSLRGTSSRSDKYLFATAAFTNDEHRTNNNYFHFSPVIYTGSITDRPGFRGLAENRFPEPTT